MSLEDSEHIAFTLNSYVYVLIYFSVVILLFINLKRSRLEFTNIRILIPVPAV